MIKQIVRDVFFLGQPSEPATKEDISIGRDLQDTLQANRERCVGMTANVTVDITIKMSIIFDVTTNITLKRAIEYCQEE